MGRLLPLFLGVFATLHLLGVSAQTAPACVETCTNEVRNKFADLKCTDANAAACFCTNPTFSAAILECSKPQCGATADNVLTYLSAHFCAGQPPLKADKTAEPSSEASQTPTSSNHATTSTSAAAPTTSATSPSTTAATATTTSASSESTTTSASAESTTTSAAVETTGTSITSVSPSFTSDSAPSATSTAAAAATEGPSKGLSQAAIAGIGVGIGAAVIAIAGVIICMLLKARRRKPTRNGNNRDISKPYLGTDRMYAERDSSFRRDRDHSMEKFGNDLEMTSHRYEDMVPRTQPRTLV